MRKLTLLLSLTSAMALSACLDNDLECGLAGAAGGAVVADATGGNAVTGAALGGAAGVLANDVNPNLCN